MYFNILQRVKKRSWICIIKNQKIKAGDDIALDSNKEKEREESVKAIALIRAYRIRGHLIANLDPLGMM